MQINNSMQLGRHAETLRLASITKNVIAQVQRKEKKKINCTLFKKYMHLHYSSKTSNRTALCSTWIIELTVRQNF